MNITQDQYSEILELFYYVGLETWGNTAEDLAMRVDSMKNQLVMAAEQERTNTIITKD